MDKFTAKISNLDITPRKVRLSLTNLTGLPVADAEATLLSRRERSAQPILKLLRSAVANAKNAGQSPDNLFVSSIRADKGMRLKRWLPRAQGRATALHKQRSHVYLEIAVNPEKKPRFSYSGQSAESVRSRKTGKKTGLGAERKPKAAEIKAEKGEKPGFFKRSFRRKTIAN
jgi:large subunit ribosomal protein L22